MLTKALAEPFPSEPHPQNLLQFSVHLLLLKAPSPSLRLGFGSSSVPRCTSMILTSASYSVLGHFLNSLKIGILLKYVVVGIWLIIVFSVCLKVIIIKSLIFLKQ